uniref:DNA-dependent metalloprotease SPRTN n=1 Tax=Monopterus albus TaxID=43700 RepID=A0A3Q3IX34_MONAL
MDKNMDDDFLLAIQLQEQFDNEYETSLFASNDFGGNEFCQISKKQRMEIVGGGSDVVPWRKPTVQLERPLSIVDKSWEMLDPSPDVRAMFLQFNDMFFWGKLSGVEVKWSPRMTLCAGVCSYEGRGGLCSIRLSEPLLKLRPRKDLVQTLLHEMIHALLFVTQNNRDRDGHGPEFCKHMNRINKASGTNITIYHSFHDEVDVYRQHWWRCNGPCQNRKPYFGYVKRAINRAPSSLDPWWEDHQRTCGGTYTKIKEPDGYSKKGKKDGKKDVTTSVKKASGNGKPSSTSTGDKLISLLCFNSYKCHSKLFTPSSPAKSLTSPAHPGLDNRTKGSTAAFPFTGPKPPIKRSVSNTKIFVNINGSPVRIPKPHSSSSSHGADKIKQRPITDLFNDTELKKSVSETFVTNTEAERDLLASPRSTRSATTSSSSPSTSKPSTSNHSESFSVVPSRSSPAKLAQSSYFTDSNSERTLEAAGGGQRKRQWHERRSSASIADFFQKTSGSNIAAPRESIKTKSPAVQQRSATAISSSSFSAGLHSVTSSSELMVSCPVCQAKVQEGKINEHLDSCLS